MKEGGGDGHPADLALTSEHVRDGVKAYNERFASLEVELHGIARDAQEALSEGSRGGDVVLRFARKVNAWGRIRASSGTWPMARDAVEALPWNDLRQLDREFTDGRADLVVDLCEQVVAGIRERGGRRREYSYTSKMLHWLWPEQVPVNDTYVREVFLGIDGQGREPYRQLVLWTFQRARELEPFESDVVGDVPPRTLLRAIDKAVWWDVDQARP